MWSNHSLFKVTRSHSELRRLQPLWSFPLSSSERSEISTSHLIILATRLRVESTFWAAVPGKISSLIAMSLVIFLTRCSRFPKCQRMIFGDEMCEVEKISKRIGSWWFICSPCLWKFPLIVTGTDFPSDPH